MKLKHNATLAAALVLVLAGTAHTARSVSYTHDAQGRELSRTEAAGTPEERTFTTEWHNQWHLPARIPEPGMVTTFVHDGVGQLLGRNETTVQ